MLGIIPPALIIYLWSLLTSGAVESRVLSPLILPSPVEVISSFSSLWFDAELSRSLLASTLRVVTGFIIGTAIALPLSVLMGAFSKFKKLFEPTTVFLAYLPIPALVPLTMSLFGIGEIQKIMFLALSFLIYLIPLFIKAFDEVDNVYLQTAYTLGVKRWKAITRVLFPIAFPKIIHAMRLGFGVGYLLLNLKISGINGLEQQRGISKKSSQFFMHWEMLWYLWMRRIRSLVNVLLTMKPGFQDVFMQCLQRKCPIPQTVGKSSGYLPQADLIL